MFQTAFSSWAPQPALHVSKIRGSQIPNEKLPVSFLFNYPLQSKDRGGGSPSYSLWPGTGWPVLELLGLTPLDLFRRHHQTGTVRQTDCCCQRVKNTKNSALRKMCLVKDTGVNSLAASTWYPEVLVSHQHQADQPDQADPAMKNKTKTKSSFEVFKTIEIKKRSLTTFTKYTFFRTLH